jgi:hypothetical protein
MKYWMRLFLAVTVIFLISSCTKEKLDYEKMPDSGYKEFNCGDNRGK